MTSVGRDDPQGQNCPVGAALCGRPPGLRRRMFPPPFRRGGSPDPPAGFGTGFIPRGGFRPAGRVSFPAMGKKPKDRRGRLTSPSGTGSLRLQFVLPRTPIYGGYPYPFPQNFRRAKYGSGYDPSRAAGPWCGAKFRPVPFYRRAWFRPAVAEGAGRGAPDEAVPKPGGMTGETSCNGGRASLGLAPTAFSRPRLVRRDRRGFTAAAAIASPRTEIAS
jgi:hypothetical protein